MESFKEETTCPVPKQQQPQEEFNELIKSCFFSLAIKKDFDFYKILFAVWSLLLPISYVILNSSWELKGNTLILLYTSSITSLFLPFFILCRLWLGWKYILKRLQSEKIEYEETGWYDGQTWEKPFEWKEKEFLIAQYEVKPIVVKIEKTLSTLTIVILIGLLTNRAILSYH